ncbi:hypothetical protein QSH18_00270 [Xanthomonas sp. NCPPB 2654]|uniref:hypothetical protein n=1 Tax=unclassified Xanthomonas TaxID=2643310 RepID=UPI0021DFB69F|nr:MULTISPECIES: hypothetical protein [unclassified Xanthomonas]MDL5364036.1 hypothetical protein [Xanthomonas sp. NCPPB 2654]UYC20962.1 hypothetical protein NUG20_01245 [Xanthomonas sp. CFBP 8443]
MNEAQQLANAHLHALAEAYQHGRIGRDEYRARRRNVLAAARSVDQGVTHRNALRPTVAAAAPARARHEPLPLLFADAHARRRRRLLAAFIFVTLFALLLLFFAGAMPAFAGHSKATAVAGTLVPCPAAHLAAAHVATTGSAGARQGIVPGEIECV